MSYTLTTEIPLTRRSKRHEVRNEKGERVFTSRSIGQCLAYLVENDIRRVEVISAHGYWLVDIEPMPWQPDTDRPGDPG